MDRQLTRGEWSGPDYSVVDMNWPPELGIEHMIREVVVCHMMVIVPELAF